MADSPDAVVRAFIKEWDAEHPDIQHLLTYFADDAVYHNLPAKPAVGKAAIEKTLQYANQFNSQGWEIVNQTAAGNVVINERRDRFIINGNDVELPVCGVFELRDGKIAAWRDYFDMATFQKQMGS